MTSSSKSAASVARDLTDQDVSAPLEDDPELLNALDFYGFQVEQLGLKLEAAEAVIRRLVGWWNGTVRVHPWDEAEDFLATLQSSGASSISQNGQGPVRALSATDGE